MCVCISVHFFGIYQNGNSFNLWNQLVLSVGDRIIHQYSCASECISIVTAEKCKVYRGR